MRRLLVFVYALSIWTGCGSAEPPEEVITEIREWESGCHGPRIPSRTPIVPDTLQFSVAEPDSFRVTALGGCVGGYMYVREREIRAVIDTLQVREAFVPWPFEEEMEVRLETMDEEAMPGGLDSLVVVVLHHRGQMLGMFLGYSPRVGIVWGEVIHGGAFRLARVERSTGESLRIQWPLEYYPMGGDLSRGETDRPPPREPPRPPPPPPAVIPEPPPPE